MHYKKMKVALDVMEDVHIHVALETRVLGTWKIIYDSYGLSVERQRHIG